MKVNFKPFRIAVISFAILFFSLHKVTGQLNSDEYTRRADSLLFLKEYESALIYFYKAKEINRQNGSRVDFISCLEKIMTCYMYLGSYDVAISEAEKIVNRDSSKHILDQIERAQAFSNLGYIYLRKGQVKLSYEHHFLALNKWQTLLEPNHEKIGKSYYYLGGVYLRETKYNQALLFYQKALKVFEQNDKVKPTDLALVYNNIGLVYRGQSLPHLALEFYNLAIRTQTEKTEIAMINKSYFYNNIGLFYNELGQNRLSIKYLLKSLSIKRVYRRHNHPRNASAYSNLGLVFMENEQYHLALENLQKSIAITEESFGQTHHSVATTLTFLGMVYEQIQQPSKALQQYERALEIQKKLYGNYHADIALTLNTLGSLYCNQGDYLEAFYCYQKAIAANVPGFSDSTSNSTHTLSNALKTKYLLVSMKGKSRYLLRKGRIDDLKQAMHTLEMADSLANMTREVQTNYKDKVEWSNTMKGIYEMAIRVCVTLAAQTRDNYYNKKAFYFSEKSRSSVLLEAINDLKAKGFGLVPEGLVIKERSLKLEKNDYFAKIQKAKKSSREADSLTIEFWEEKLFQTNRSFDSLNSYLERNYPKYYKLKYQSRLINVDEVQRRLKNNEAYIEYFIGQNSTYIFAISQTKFNICSLTSDAHLNDKIKMFRDIMKSSFFEGEDGLGEFTRLSNQLYKNYVEPVVSQLDSGVNQLIIIPDEQLRFIPFDILVSERNVATDYRDLPFILKKYTTQYGYSASILFNEISKRRKQVSEEFMAFAPSYKDAKKADSENFLIHTKFRDKTVSLKYNQSEIQMINEYMNGETFAGIRAQEKFFKTSATDCRVLHLAMHAFVDHENPMSSKLVFTQSQDTLEDNFLHAYELYNMELSADMVVLSACETGFGKLERGEGVMSLARAFAYAGCPSVVMSHWAVNDAATSELMRLFYKYLSKGLKKDVALQRAKLEFLQSADAIQVNPYFWGSFVVMGDVSPLKRQERLLWLFYAIGILLVAGIVFFIVNKIKNIQF